MILKKIEMHLYKYRYINIYAGALEQSVLYILVYKQHLNNIYFNMTSGQGLDGGSDWLCCGDMGRLDWLCHGDMGLCIIKCSAFLCTNKWSVVCS